MPLQYCTNYYHKWVRVGVGVGVGVGVNRVAHSATKRKRAGALEKFSNIHNKKIIMLILCIPEIKMFTNLCLKKKIVWYCQKDY